MKSIIRNKVEGICSSIFENNNNVLIFAVGYRLVSYFFDWVSEAGIKLLLASINLGIASKDKAIKHLLPFSARIAVVV